MLNITLSVSPLPMLQEPSPALKHELKPTLLALSLRSQLPTLPNGGIKLVLNITLSVPPLPMLQEPSPALKHELKPTLLALSLRSQLPTLVNNMEKDEAEGLSVVPILMKKLEPAREPK